MTAPIQNINFLIFISPLYGVKTEDTLLLSSLSLQSEKRHFASWQGSNEGISNSLSQILQMSQLAPADPNPSSDPEREKGPLTTEWLPPCCHAVAQHSQGQADTQEEGKWKWSWFICRNQGRDGSGNPFALNQLNHDLCIYLLLLIVSSPHRALWEKDTSPGRSTGITHKIFYKVLGEYVNIGGKGKERKREREREMA